MLARELNMSSEQWIARSADGERRRVGTITTPQSSVEVPVAFVPTPIQCLSTGAELIQGLCNATSVTQSARVDDLSGGLRGTDGRLLRRDLFGREPAGRIDQIFLCKTGQYLRRDLCRAPKVCLE